MNAPDPGLVGEYQLLSAPGPAAITVLRLRGTACDAFLREHILPVTTADIATWQVGRVLRARLRDVSGEPVDDILLSIHATGPEWDVRLHLHGSQGVVQACRELLEACGFAEHHETISTLWHSETTIAAEALARIPEMLTFRGVQWLLRQSKQLPDCLRQLAGELDQDAARDGIRQIIARGTLVDRFIHPVRIALIGPPNAGKSTLINALADRQVSIVSTVPGTTRDWVETPGEIAGFPITWLDTAGLGPGRDTLESEGIRRTKSLIKTADAVMFVLDSGAAGAALRERFLSEYAHLDPVCIALNKQDLDDVISNPQGLLPDCWLERAVPVSATVPSGLESLLQVVLAALGYEESGLEQPAAFTQRQRMRLDTALVGGRNCFREMVLACISE